MAWRHVLVELGDLTIEVSATGAGAEAFGLQLEASVDFQEVCAELARQLATLRGETVAREEPGQGEDDDGGHLAAASEPDGEPVTQDRGGVQADPGLAAATEAADAALARAWRAGAGAGRKLRGETGAVPKTPRHPQGLPARFYVVIRGMPGADVADGVWRRYWASTAEAGAQAAVGTWDPAGHFTLHHEAVFHGFPSFVEVEAYCEGAGVAVPPWRP